MSSQAPDEPQRFDEDALQHAQGGLQPEPTSAEHQGLELMDAPLAPPKGER